MYCYNFESFFFTINEGVWGGSLLQWSSGSFFQLCLQTPRRSRFGSLNPKPPFTRFARKEGAFLKFCLPSLEGNWWDFVGGSRNRTSNIVLTTERTPFLTTQLMRSYREWQQCSSRACVWSGLNNTRDHLSEELYSSHDEMQQMMHRYITEVRCEK